MALLDGILGGAQSVQAFGQQQFQNKLARDKFDEQKRQYDQSYEENVRQFNINDVYNRDANTRANTTTAQATDKFNTEKKTAANDKIYETYDVAGLISQDRMNLDVNKIRAGIENGDLATEQIVLGFATQFGSLPEGTVAESIKPLPNGGYAVTVRNADGSEGVVTEDGKSEAGSRVINFEAGQLARLANAEFRRNVLTDTTKINPTDMRTRLNQIDADSELQGVNDQIADLRYEQEVLSRLPDDPGLQRSAKSAIAEGGSEVTKALGDDVGVAKETVQVPSEGREETRQESEATPPATTWSLDDVDRTTKGGQLIASIEGVSKRASNPRSKRATTSARQREKLLERRTELETTISNAEKLRAQTPDFKIDPKRDNLPKSKAELAQIDAYLNKDQPASVLQFDGVAAQEAEAVGTQLENKSTEDIKTAVDNGEVKLSSETQQQIAQKLEAEGFRELRDLRRLKGKDAAIARAAILSSSGDANIRQQMSTEITNIMDNVENSPSMSRKDEIDDGATARTYRLNRAKYNKSVYDALKGDFETANERSAALIETTTKLFFGENSDEQNFNAETANQLFKGPALNGFLTRMKTARTEAEANQYMLGLNAAISLGMAGLAGEQDGGIAESIADFFVRGEVTDNNNPIDFELRRVIANDTENPTEFYYTDADGNKTDEKIDAKELQNISESVYEIVREQAIANTPKPKGE